MSRSFQGKAAALAAAVSFFQIYPSPSRVREWVKLEHWRRYVLGWMFSVAGIVSVACVYMMFWPVSYKSEWTLILPGAGAGSNVNLSSIGQASSIIASPFGQSSLSPKAIYKAIASSDAVLEKAGEKLGVELREFGKPQVKLIEQTALMMFTISGKTAALAQSKAEALHGALEEQLRKLRQDEIDKRERAVRDNLFSYSANLDKARNNVIEFQQRTGLVSTAQFAELTLSVEHLRRKLADARVQSAKLKGEQGTLVSELGIGPERAAQAIALAADPAAIRLLRDLAEAGSTYADRSSRYGYNHPQVVREKARISKLRQALIRSVARFQIKKQQALELMFIVDTPARADLLQGLVRRSAELEGINRQIAELEAALPRAQAEVERRSSQAAQLENLQKKQLVAEAVYSSAVARVDTNRSDIYASYPLVQVLAAPTLPERPANPRLLFAFIGAFLGMCLATGAWFMAWLHQLFVLRRSKKS